jgi:hypothetical protein
VPAALDAVVLRALSAEPADRYPWAAGLAEALRPFAAGSGPASLAGLLAELFEPELARERAWLAGG